MKMHSKLKNVTEYDKLKVIYIAFYSVQRIRNPSLLAPTTMLSVVSSTQRIFNTGNTMIERMVKQKLVEKFISKKLEQFQSILSSS